MFGPRPRWSDYETDIIAFSQLIGGTPWQISPPSHTFLRSVQRGYARISLTGATDCWRAVAAACLWNACCHPERLQLLMAGSASAGQAWIRFLRNICGESTRMLREHLLFTEDENMVMVPASDDPVLFVLTPGHLLGASKVRRGRTTVLVMPDIDRVATESYPALKSFVTEPGDQWIAALPPRK
jgi:hypothetical protein